MNKKAYRGRRHKNRKYRKIRSGLCFAGALCLFFAWEIITFREEADFNGTETDDISTETDETGMDDVGTETDDVGAEEEFLGTQTEIAFDLESIPVYCGDPYVVIDDNIPDFSDMEYRTEQGMTEAFEQYSELDGLGRCGAAYALLGQELMPTEERGEIGPVRPSGWHTVKYDCIEGNYLYNRCHLIGYQLAGENANERNLITGTRYLNVQGMLPFENDVASYIRTTNHHVLYRVTPAFQGEDLIAAGVRMEAYSLEDDGVGICFDVFAYNVQPGVVIDYATGESYAEETMQ